MSEVTNSAQRLGGFEHLPPAASPADLLHFILNHKTALQKVTSTELPFIGVIQTACFKAFDTAQVEDNHTVPVVKVEHWCEKNQMDGIDNMSLMIKTPHCSVILYVYLQNKQPQHDFLLRFWQKHSFLNELKKKEKWIVLDWKAGSKKM